MLSGLFDGERQTEREERETLEELKSQSGSHFHSHIGVKGSIKRQAPDLLNFVAVVAYHSLPAAFTQPGDRL